MTTAAARLLTLAAVAVPLALAACGDDAPQRTETNYCTQVGNHLADLNATAIASSSDVSRVLAAWRAVAATAPIAIETEWTAMVRNVETAATVDPNDPASMQRVADTARESEPAANRVIAYTQQKCGALIGSVAPTATSAAPATAAPATTGAAAETTTTTAGAAVTTTSA